MLGNSLDDSSVLSLKKFLNEINKNVPVLLIVDGIDKIDNNNFKIDELRFIDNRLGLINGRYDSIENRLSHILMVYIITTFNLNCFLV